jgi:hypothetical protein
MGYEAYDGFSNWQTWRVYLWLTKDEALYDASRTIARDTTSTVPEFTATAQLEDLVRCMIPDFEAKDGIWKDLIQACALRDVNWQELVNALRVK